MLYTTYKITQIKLKYTCFIIINFIDIYNELLRTYFKIIFSVLKKWWWLISFPVNTIVLISYATSVLHLIYTLIKRLKFVRVFRREKYDFDICKGNLFWIRNWAKNGQLLTDKSTFVTRLMNSWLSCWTH